MLRRIVAGIGANAFSQIVSIFIQLASLPVFLLFWDASTYGAWLLLTAVPAYLSFADLGMVATAGNKMTMAMGRSDLKEANSVYQSAQLFTTIVTAALAAIVTPLILFLPLPDAITVDKRITLAALAWIVLLSIYGGLSDTVFKATGRYAPGIMLAQMVRIGEWVGYIAGLILFRTFAGVALTGLVANAIGVCARIYLAQRGSHGLKLGFEYASKAELLGMMKPALSFVSLSVSNALSFQGMTLLVGVLEGAATVVLFNAYRTIARVAIQLTWMFSLALWPEFARIYGEGGAKAVFSLYRRSALLNGVQAVAVSVLLFFIAPWLLQVWTHGRIPFQPGLMLWLLIYAAVGGISSVPRVLLVATNQHFSMSNWTLAAAVFSIGLGWLFGKFWQVDGVGAAMLMSELFQTAITFYIVTQAFGPPPAERIHP
jgi:O-antigen/teichoic acid export membrane protein